MEEGTIPRYGNESQRLSEKKNEESEAICIHILTVSFCKLDMSNSGGTFDVMT